MKPCPDCDRSVPGIRGMCLEHRAQIAEELLLACEGALAYMEDRGRYDTAERAAPLRAAIKKARGQ